jgi:hypothetical protein
MASAKARLLEEALRLPPDQRAELAGERLATLEPDTPSEWRTEAEWIGEVERRARAAMAGNPGAPGRRPAPRFRADCRAGEGGPLLPGGGQGPIASI